MKLWNLVLWGLKIIQSKMLTNHRCADFAIQDYYLTGTELTNTLLSFSEPTHFVTESVITDNLILNFLSFSGPYLLRPYESEAQT